MGPISSCARSAREILRPRPLCVKPRPFLHDRHCYREFLDEKIKCKSNGMDLEAIEALSLMLVTADYLDWIYFELQVLNVSSKSGGALAPVATPVPTPMQIVCV